MGMFDTVRFTCPSCLEPVLVHSKAGDCRLEEFNAESGVPLVIAADLEHQDAHCESCGSRLCLLVNPPVLALRMRVVKVG